MARKERSGPITATELMAQLANDPEYQRKKRAFAAEVAARASVLRVAEQPIVRDLAVAGVEVESVWDLVNTAEPYPDALPVLMKHLERGDYPERVRESLGRALAMKPSVQFWDRLKALYSAPRDPGEEDGTAVALAACATEGQLDDLVSFLALRERGESRIYFIRPILRVGRARGREIVEALRADPVFGREATALLSRRK
jgi:hypothetical protein